MELGLIGLGRMGANMAERLKQAGHHVVGYDRALQADVSSIPALVSMLHAPRAVWLMIPAGTAVDDTINVLIPLLSKSDIIIDGGNSNYKESMRRADSLSKQGILFVDVGTSGGVWGLKEGYCLMIGGEPRAVHRLKPLFEALAPSADRGWAHVGPAGAGHFAKMIHNGIEYGLMQAYAEGFSVLKNKDTFNFDLKQIAELWRHGSVVRSWLLDLTAEALAENPKLEGIAPVVADSGEGRWTVAEAIEQNVPIPIITMSLLERIRSRELESFANKMLAVMRNKFGGHDVKKG